MVFDFLFLFDWLIFFSLSKKKKNRDDRKNKTDNHKSYSVAWV